MKTQLKVMAVAGVVALGALWGTGCQEQCPDPTNLADPTCDGGFTVPDSCNSLSEALSDPACVLTQDVGYLGYISVPNDQDWLSLTTPATVNARTLLRITAGYGVPSTNIQLAVNLMQSDGTTSLARVVDQHGAQAPKPLEILQRFTTPGAQLVVLLSDQPTNPTLPQYDPRNQYQITWSLAQDPDSNEPNDSTATPIPLTGGAGSATGVLATPDDQDLFSLAGIAAGKIVYFHITENTPTCSPSNACGYRLAYTFYGPPESGFPNGRPLGEGMVDNVFQTVNLATARLTSLAGVHTISIHAYREPGVLGPLPGDERLRYKIDVLVVDQLDTHEPNNTLIQSQGSAVTLVSNTLTSFTGRIGSVGDPDWFAVDLPSNAQPTVLHYKLRPPASGSGRFPALPTVCSPTPCPDHAVHVVTEVTTGVDAAARTLNCQTDATVCPKGYAGNPLARGAVEAVCARTPPQCLWSYREEDLQYANLKNFEGRIPVAAHPGGSVRYYILVEDIGNNWADDRDYTLEVTLRPDPDEASRASLLGQTQVMGGLANDTGGTFPTPPGSATVLAGDISHGYGRLYKNDPALGQGIRGPVDYDAVESDIDRFEIGLPSFNPYAGPTDRTWELEFTVSNAGGGVPYGLFLDLEFCDGTQTATDGGSCAVVAESKGGGALRLAYTSANLQSWWNQAGPNFVPVQRLYLDGGVGGDFTATASAYGCFCFEPRFLEGGKFYVSVGALDRSSWNVASYVVRTAYTSYPRSFTGSQDGGTMTCPLATDAGLPGGFLDAGWSPGCNFTK